jgi:hypothetical protein
VTGAVTNTLILARYGDATFASPLAIAPGSPYVASIGDFNGDGKLDVAITHGRYSTHRPSRPIRVVLNTGARTFTLNLVEGFPVPSGGYNVFWTQTARRRYCTFSHPIGDVRDCVIE